MARAAISPHHVSDRARINEIIPPAPIDPVDTVIYIDVDFLDFTSVKIKKKSKTSYRSLSIDTDSPGDVPGGQIFLKVDRSFNS